MKQVLPSIAFSLSLRFAFLTLVVLFPVRIATAGPEDEDSGDSGANVAPAPSRPVDSTESATTGSEVSDGVLVATTGSRRLLESTGSGGEVRWFTDEAGAVSRGAPAEFSAVNGPSSASSAAELRIIQPRTARRARQPSWIQVRDLTPEFRFSESLPEKHPDILPPWSLFDSELHSTKYLDFVDVGRTPLLHCPPPREPALARAFKEVVRKKVLRELRRAAKRQLRRAFRQTPSMSFEFYEDRVKEIRKLGKDDGRFDLLQPSLDEFEPDDPILAWGPFVVTNSGSVRLDLGRLKDPDSLEKVELDGDKETTYRPILHSRDYRIHTSVRLSIDPLRAYRESDPTWMIKSYGLNVEVDWFSDVLGRKVMSTELELALKRRGDWAVMFNFVIKSRSPPSAAR